MIGGGGGGGEEYRRQERKVGEIGGNHATMLNILQLKNKAKKIGVGAGTARCNSPGASRLTPLVLRQFKSCHKLNLML